MKRLHALTLPEAIKPEAFREKIREVAAAYLACGVDPEKSIVFIQSQVPAHAELTSILNCIMPVGWLERMTQYKSKSVQADSVSTALLDYPVLQAADILLYKTNLVAVGEDQKQRVELTADIARRFNRLFGEVFVIPQRLLRPSGVRIMGLDDPSIKMSKSLGEIRKSRAIGLLDSPDTIRETIMGAVTDSGKETRFDHASPAIRNLLTIFQILSGGTRQEIEAQFEAKGYSYLKREVADLVIVKLTPIRNRCLEIIRDRAYLEEVLSRGAEKARTIAESTLSRVKELVGIGAPASKREGRGHSERQTASKKRPALSKELNPNTLEILRKRYFLKNEAGEVIEDFEGMCRRVAHHMAAAEPNEPSGRRMAIEREFYEIMVEQKIMPNSPTLFNAGTAHPMLSACFILPVGDSIREIYKAVADGAVIEKFGGGIGMDFSRVRPRATLTSTGGGDERPFPILIRVVALAEHIRLCRDGGATMARPRSMPGPGCCTSSRPRTWSRFGGWMRLSFVRSWRRAKPFCCLRHSTRSRVGRSGSTSRACLRAGRWHTSAADLWLPRGP